MSNAALISKLQAQAEWLHGLGPNIVVIAEGAKGPQHKWKHLQQQRQTRSDLQHLPWDGWNDVPPAAGIGIVHGIGGVRCFDVDECEGYAVVLQLLHAIGLPDDYPWVERTRRGWHIWVFCHDELPDGALPAKKDEAGVFTGPSKDGTFDHLELRWKNCQTIITPSIHPVNGQPYSFVREAPTDAPATVTVGAIINAFYAVAKRSDDTSAPAPKPRRQESTSAQSDNINETIRQRLDLVAFARHLFPGDERDERNGEVRITGHGGLLIKPEKNVWYNFLDEVGGDCFDLAGHALYNGTWNRNDARMFLHAQQEAATFAGVTIPDKAPQPAFDADIAYCPHGHGQVVRSFNGNGWRCPNKCGFWWKDEGYMPPPTATPAQRVDPETSEMLDDATPIINQTDLGNARRLVARHGDKIRYVPAWGVFLVWNGSFWERDETGAVARLARDTVRAMYDEASKLDDVEARRSLAKWALASESRARLENMVALAKDEPGISIKHTQLDANPWLLTCRNTTINLRTGVAGSHCRDDLITKRIEVDYDPDAPCAIFERFLHRIMGGDMQLITFLQRAFGYTLTGDTSEQCLFYLYGTGKNGKSTWSEILMYLLGAYALKTPTEMLMAKQYGGGIPNDVARLPGMRMALAAEVEEGKRLAEALVKDLTGGDTMTARFLREEFFDFKPTHKLWMYGNHKPVIRGTDDGIWRRFHLIPFNEWITPEEEDPHLKDKLVAELPGILAWAVRGCLAWQREGLGVPQAVRDATSSYRNDMDVLGGFLSERTINAPRRTTLVAAMYAEYDKWCESNGEHALKKRDFDTKLKERGFTTDKGGKNKTYWQGIALLDTEDRTPPGRHDTGEQEPDANEGYQGYQGYPVSSMNGSYINSHERYQKVSNPDNLDNPAVEEDPHAMLDLAREMLAREAGGAA